MPENPGAPTPAALSPAVLTVSRCSDRFEMLRYDQLAESKHNPRKTFDAAELQELADSIKSLGRIITPLLVRPSGKRFEIAAGHRRYRAAKLAGLAELPAIVRTMSDLEFVEVLNVENLQRKDLHPLEEADGYRTLIETWRSARRGESGRQDRRDDVAEVAQRVGKSVSYVYQRLKLGSLAPKPRRAFTEGELTAGHAILIARLSPADQDRALSLCFQERFEGGKFQKVQVSVRSLARIIEMDIHKDLAKAPFKKDDENLLPEAGSCKACPKRTVNNQELYADFGKADHCTDGTCFEAKLQAHLEQVVAAAGVGAIRITETNYSKPRKGIFLAGDYRVAKKGECASVVNGVFVEGRRFSQTELVCADRKCKKHWAGHLSLKSLGGGDYRAEELRRQKKAKAETARRLAILGAIRERIQGPPTGRVFLEMFAEAMWDRMWMEDQKRILKQFDWDPKKHDLRKPPIKKMSDQELAVFLVSCTVAGELFMSPHSTFELGKSSRLIRAAQAFKVNITKIKVGEAEKKKGKSAVRTSAKKRPGLKPRKDRPAQARPVGLGLGL